VRLFHGQFMAGEGFDLRVQQLHDDRSWPDGQPEPAAI
jgi:hypothetical protein